jgi:hypothetical protein
MALLMERTHHPATICFENFSCPMVHLVTGKTILSYKKMMNELATAETRQTTFGKIFKAWLKGITRLYTRG